MANRNRHEARGPVDPPEAAGVEHLLVVTCLEQLSPSDPDGHVRCRVDECAAAGHEQPVAAGGLGVQRDLLVVVRQRNVRSILDPDGNRFRQTVNPVIIVIDDKMIDTGAESGRSQIQFRPVSGDAPFLAGVL